MIINKQKDELSNHQKIKCNRNHNQLELHLLFVFLKKAQLKIPIIRKIKEENDKIIVRISFCVFLIFNCIKKRHLLSN